ncbi:MAG TPA: dihydrofolate reductase family protein [Candidatus Acidoferrum sp.]
MSKLIMWNVMTLNGLFEGAKSWDLDFHQTVWGDELEQLSIDQLKTADRLIFGRVTYEGMAAYWQTATDEVAVFMNSLPKVVFSRTLASADWNNTTLVKGDVAAEINNLKRDGNKNTFVFGSANLCATLMQHNLFDEYRLAIAPVVLGTGKPLFPPNASQLQFKLLDSRTLSNGCVILRYTPISNQ